MAERNLSIRLAVMDGGKVKAELKEIGESGEKSLQRIELAGKPASKSLIALNAAANDVKGAAIGLSSQMGPLGAGLAALGPAGIAAGAGLAIMALGIKRSFEEAALRVVLMASGLRIGRIIALRSKHSAWAMGRTKSFSLSKPMCPARVAKRGQLRSPCLEQ